MSSSLWSGRTLYMREFDDGGRELFVPQGTSLAADPHLCWRVKQDPVSGKFFFVNVAGFGKRWRLPDLKDEQYMAELRQKLQAAAAMPPAGAAQRVSSRNVSSAPTASEGAFFSTVASSPVLFVATPSAQRATSGPSAYAPGTLMSQGAQQPPRQVGNAFLYDDDEWKAMEAEKKRREEMLARDSALRLQREMELEEMKKGIARGIVPLHVLSAAQEHTGEYPQQPSVAIHRTPFDDFVDHSEASRQTAVQFEMQRRQQERDERQRAMESEMMRLEAEEKELAEQRMRDERLVQQLQDEQQQRVRENSQQVPTVGNPYSSGMVYSSPTPAAIPSQLPNQQQQPQQHQQHYYSQPPQIAATTTPHRTSAMSFVDPYLSSHPSAQQQNSSDQTKQVEQLTSVIETLQKMLDHERRQNEKLQRQLDEKERIALEQLAAEAERDQREVALRIRMMEAIAAHRREQQLLADEEAARREVQEDTLRGQLARQGGRYVPEHPLKNGMSNGDDYDY